MHDLSKQPESKARFLSPSSTFPTEKETAMTQEQFAVRKGLRLSRRR